MFSDQRRKLLFHSPAPPPPPEPSPSPTGVWPVRGSLGPVLINPLTHWALRSCRAEPLSSRAPDLDWRLLSYIHTLWTHS